MRHFVRNNIFSNELHKHNRHYTDLMIFVGAGLVPAHNGGKHKALPTMGASTRHCPQWGQAQGIAHNGGKHKALPLQNVNDFLIGINSNEFLKFHKNSLCLCNSLLFLITTTIAH